MSILCSSNGTQAERTLPPLHGMEFWCREGKPRNKDNGENVHELHGRNESKGKKKVRWHSKIPGSPIYIGRFPPRRVFNMRDEVTFPHCKAQPVENRVQIGGAHDRLPIDICHLSTPLPRHF